MHGGIRTATEADSRGGRVVGGSVIAVLFMGSTLVTPLYDLYATAYGLSVVGIGLLYAVYVVGNLVALLFLGKVSDQVGRRPVVLASVVLAGLSTLLFLFARTPAWLFWARASNGLAVGLGSGAATAWITEFTAPTRRAAAASIMTTFNFIGLTLGVVLSGVLVQYEDRPLRLPFEVYAALLVALLLLVVLTPETLRQARPSRIAWRPRLGVPRDARRAFVAPAAAGFAAMALVGFYAALGPSMIRESLHVTNHAWSAAIVAELFVVAAIVIFATRGAAARVTLQFGLLSMPLGVALLVAAQRTNSMALMLASSAVCGLSGALGYRSGLAVANGLAPEGRRAEVASTYFVCCFLGNALPIIGVTALAQFIGLGAASLVFAVIVSLLGVAALVVLRARKPAIPVGN